MFAIVDIAGFQEKIQKGAKIRVPSLALEPGKSVTFDKVLMTGDGDTIKIGAPFLSGISVEAKVLEHGRGDKIRIVKTKRRKRYKRVKGHRQGFTEIEIVGIKS